MGDTNYDNIYFDAPGEMLLKLPTATGKKLAALCKQIVIQTDSYLDV